MFLPVPVLRFYSHPKQGSTPFLNGSSYFETAIGPAPPRLPVPSKNRSAAVESGRLAGGTLLYRSPPLRPVLLPGVDEICVAIAAAAASVTTALQLGILLPVWIVCFSLAALNVSELSSPFLVCCFLHLHLYNLLFYIRFFCSLLVFL